MKHDPGSFTVHVCEASGRTGHDVDETVLELVDRQTGAGELGWRLLLCAVETLQQPQTQQVTRCIGNTTNSS